MAQTLGFSKGRVVNPRRPQRQRGGNWSRCPGVGTDWWVMVRRGRGSCSMLRSPGGTPWGVSTNAGVWGWTKPDGRSGSPSEPMIRGPRRGGQPIARPSRRSIPIRAAPLRFAAIRVTTSTSDRPGSLVRGCDPTESWNGTRGAARMLVLSRKLMEKVYIGDDICVTVVRLENGQVRLGIDAPRHIPVVRAELQDQTRNRRGGTPARASAHPTSSHPHSHNHTPPQGLKTASTSSR